MYGNQSSTIANGSGNSSLSSDNEIFTGELHTTIKRLAGIDDIDDKVTKKYTFVCAIDFGSTYSGYAYAYTKQPEIIRVMKDVSSTYGTSLYQKIPTVLLLDDEENIVSFGYDAKLKYQKMDESVAKNYNYFDKFKMKLYYSKNISSNLLITATNGTFHSALKVFSLSLGYMKNLFLDEIKNEFSVKIPENKIKWVITVPSIWVEESKQFMRLAAYKAGIGSGQNPDQLQIALEPEAASIYCRSLRIRDCVLDETLFTRQINKKLDSVIKFDKYIIMDCGGGTVDISVHELNLENHFIRELNVSEGGPIGGMMVNQRFESLLSEIFGSKFIKKFKKKHPINWLDIIDSFDTLKRCIKAYSTDTVNIPVPYNMVKYFKKQKGKGIESFLKSKKWAGVSWSEQGALVLSYNIVKNIFMDAVDSIIQVITQLTSKPELEGVKKCFLVGGFSNSFILQNELRNHFNNRLCIITPSDSSLSTLKGAVMFGLNSNIIKIRRACYSYGFRCLKRFNPNMHCISKKVTINDVDYCKDIFYTFVKVNDSIGHNDKIIKTLLKQDQAQNYSSFIIYRTKNPKAFYVTDEGVEVCGKFSCNLSHSTTSTHIRIEFYFGKTQIEVKALDTANNELVQSNISYFTY